MNSGRTKTLTYKLNRLPIPYRERLGALQSNATGYPSRVGRGSGVLHTNATDSSSHIGRGWVLYKQTQQTPHPDPGGGWGVGYPPINANFLAAYPNLFRR